MAFIPAFSEPQSHWPRASPLPALGQSWGEARAAGVAPRGTPPTVSPHPGMIGPYLRFIHPSISLQLRHSGDENRVLPGLHRPARCGNPNPRAEHNNRTTPLPTHRRTPPPTDQAIHPPTDPPTMPQQYSSKRMRWFVLELRQSSSVI